MFINNNYRLNEKALYNKKTNNSFNAQEKNIQQQACLKLKHMFQVVFCLVLL